MIFDMTSVSNNFAGDFPSLSKAITSGKVKAVTGGTKYKSEITKSPPLARMLIAMEKAGRVAKMPDKDVDKLHQKIDTLFKAHPSCRRRNSKCKRPCDDPHIFALAKLSHAKHVLTKDVRILECYRCISKGTRGKNPLVRLHIMQSDKNCVDAKLT